MRVRVEQLDGLKGKLRHALLAKANLDETRTTPGAHTPYPGGSLISQAASSAEALSFLAGSSATDFTALLSNFSSVYSGAVQEIVAMKASSKGPALARVGYSLELLNSAA